MDNMISVKPYNMKSYKCVAVPLCHYHLWFTSFYGRAWYIVFILVIYISASAEYISLSVQCIFR